MEHMHISASYYPKEIELYNTLFKEFCDIFSQSYEEMVGIDPHIAIHEIKTYPRARLVQQ